MTKKRTWRTALGDIIQNPQKREALLRALNINESTLWRWVKGEVNPRRRAQLQALPDILQSQGILPEKIAELRELLREAYPDLFPFKEHKTEQEDLAASLPLSYYRRMLSGVLGPLLDIFPEQAAELRELLRGAYPDLFPSIEEQTAPEDLVSIPLSYYRRILSAYTLSTPENLKWTVYQHGLQQLVTQLVCVRGEIRVHIMHLSQTQRSLYEAACIVYDTKKIKEERGNVLSAYTHSLLFAGTETVPGQSIVLGKLVAHATEVALPFKRRGLVAGCLWVEADGFGYAQIELLKQYVDILALAFTDKEFCSQIDLQQMPEKAIQRQIIDAMGVRVVTADLISEIEDAMLHTCKEAPTFLQEEREEAQQKDPG